MPQLPSYATKNFQRTFFGEITIYYPHLQSLLDKNYLSDPIITFYLLHLAKKYEKQSKKLLFVNPTLSWMFFMLPEEDLQEQMSFLDFKTPDLIFLPVNNNTNPEEADSGTHWSLLVYHKATDKFYYYDSAKDYNLDVAKKLARKMAKAMGMRDVYFESRKAPQQKNGYDCGVFLCAIAEDLAENKGDDSSLVQHVTQEKVTKMRDGIFDLIGEYLHW